MDARYERNIPALTAAECALLQTKRVLVVGCGGLGGHLIHLLARLGIGAIRAIDGDVFEASNLNRQLLAEPALLGTNKARAARNYVARINPDISVEAVETFLTVDNASALLNDCDAVLDGLDAIAPRKILARACDDAGLPYVYGAINGWVAQAALCQPALSFISALYPADAALKDKSALSFTPALCAAMQVALCTKYLVGRPVQTNTLTYADLLNQEFETIPIM